MRTAFIQALMDVAAADSRIQLVTADLGYSVVEGFAESFPTRFINCGVAEQLMAGMSAGMAMSGRVVFTYSIANFPTMRCLEQIRNDICYHNVPVKIVAVGGGLAYGAQGYTHHGIEDLAVMAVLPHMTVIAPGDPHEVRALVPQIAALDGPCYLRLGRGGEPVVHAPDAEIVLGKAAVLKIGTDVTLISTGAMLKPALDAVAALAAQGISAGLLSMHTVRPLDVGAIIEVARRTGNLVTVEEHVLAGGLGTMVADALLEAGVPARLKKYGIGAELHGVVGSQAYLRGLIGDLPAMVRSFVEAGR
ncbi:transketolase [Paramagnetospirillum kuznetsovii]|uniref:Transketolase n=1 Tax=Paramagnetospirillum kuznetsovii TaxID=2053833 RepID=A0A364P2K9_9PROT|nr:transketolase C-terminal domain-containing protein [Paramagnetospirillum kuznetsovii]RAU23589.1 transketolase [Paramagnetospirillum kuznetsovii]